MIHVVFKKDLQANWLSFEMDGHADYAEHGSDIVCAAVSALAITTVNSIEQIAGYQPICELDDQNGGYLYVECLATLTDRQQDITQILLQNFYLGLVSIASEYQSYIQITS